MRGVNKVVISGNVGDRISFQETGAGVPACSFRIASDRHTADGSITAWVKVNVYDGLVKICKTKLKKGGYVIVEGELMNRDGQLGELTEVRAKDIVFVGRENGDPEGGRNGEGR